MNTPAIAEGGRLCVPPDFPYLKLGTITIKQRPDQTYEMSTPGCFGLPITCTYWEAKGVRENDDRWRYRLTNHSRISGSGPFSHPSRRGCQIAIWQHFIEIGLISFPENNSHLDETDKKIFDQTADAWAALPNEKPRVGDFLIMRDGSYKRFCYVRRTTAQTTTALEENYYAGRCGSVSYSGGMEPGVECDALRRETPTKNGQFWFFHHGQSGPGRKVNFMMPCRVWRVRDEC